MNKNMRTLNVERSTSTGHRLTHYNGACGNIHGHNMEWEINAKVEMDENDPSNMPVDLKDIADIIDQVDHATILGEGDEIVQRLEYSFDKVSSEENARDFIEQVFGDIVWVHEGDPTCENIAKWMARNIYRRLEPVNHVGVTLKETEKYSVRTSYGEYDEMERMKSQMGTDSVMTAEDVEENND